jgi:hypothetical protein
MFVHNFSSPWMNPSLTACSVVHDKKISSDSHYVKIFNLICILFL